MPRRCDPDHEGPSAIEIAETHGTDISAQFEPPRKSRKTHALPPEVLVTATTTVVASTTTPTTEGVATPVEAAQKEDEDQKTVPQDDHTEKAVDPVLPGSSNHNGTTAIAQTTTTATTGKDESTSRDYYFDSYAHHAIHEEMLKDEVRTRTYELAILQNKHIFKDKIVLDVGCGTGILSMFAIQAGAKHCYGVDCSAILEQARKIVERNGFKDKITLIRGKVEEIDLPVPKVDIIVSEWMGYFLLYESMLDTVLFARDKWLVEGGVIFPDKAVMYVSAMEDAQVKHERLDFWDDVYGFDMTPIKEIALREPVVDVVDAKALVTDSVPILHLDILTCTKEDLDFTATFRIQAQRNDYVHALVAYFECAFTQVHKPIGFSTAPFARYTHWKQTIFYLTDTLPICAGESIEGEITCQKNSSNLRDLDIRVKLNFQGQHKELLDQVTEYRLR
jgi:protein arginine N-methyltransferase 1